ncbi:agmatine deiminase [Streptococcus oricebi]|uniref:Putative agmatine deiminase n=1 Tax=Streptococcus oricebi TaxID=1547447 RepID=A0ABS5B767_9STRE|nr:agmatine deiminase [Streptococcus oricebi]MBP2623854.1 agmatine deiminase [Streptococcus oricebi]
MAKRITHTSPKQDGFRMPGEFEEQKQIWMLWPWRNDNWRLGAKPAQKAFLDVARAISEFEPVSLCVPPHQYENALARVAAVNDYENIRVIEMTNDDSWIRDSGPTFLVNDRGDLRAVDWDFNAWGGLVDGLYFPWDQDSLVARKVCELEGVDSYKTEGFVLEGGSIHVDGEGTVLVTEMCLLHPSRNPQLSKQEIEDKLKAYLNADKVIWVKDGIDPYETNGHIDDVACFIRPGEVACIYTEDENHPFYREAQAAYHFLSEQSDAKGRRLKVHKLCLTEKPCYLKAADSIDYAEGTIPRQEGEVAIASYLNFLIVNGGIILPQYGDVNDKMALEQVKAMFPERRVVGVETTEIAYGGGNIHCITQQEPKV